MAKTMSMTVNSWRVEWREDHRWKPRPCVLLIECKGELTIGAAHFTRNGHTEKVAGGSPICCQPCATAYVVREGLKGKITVKQMADALGR